METFSPFSQGQNPWETPQRLDAGPHGTLGQVVSMSPTVHAGKLLPVTAPHWYSNPIEAAFSAPNSTNNQLFLAAQGGGVARNFLLLRNASATANIYVGFGGPATVNSTLRIAPNTVVLFDTVVPQSDLYAYADAAAGLLAYTYSTVVLE